jgi:hypothetical protein
MQLAYISSTDALRKLTESIDVGANIVKISPKGNTLSNGVDFCCVGLESRNGTNYSIQAYGREARELQQEATVIAKRTAMPVSSSNLERFAKAKDIT